jgi:hypothetical protein
MCISARPAQFRGTSILLNLTKHHRYGQIFVLGYENTAVNHHSGPNALMLHFPAMEMTQANFIDTTDCRYIFRDLKQATMPEPVRRGGGTRSMSWTSKAPEVFDHGIYTVILAQDARDIPNALRQVPVEKRPTISAELCDFYASYRPSWPIALCCFNNAEAKKADPILVWYKPKNPNVLVAPGLDCHTGGVPDLRNAVDVDHNIYFASDEMVGGHEVNYLDHSTRNRLAGFLPRRAIGFRMNGMHPNGDFAVTHQQISRRVLQLSDIQRPGAQNPLQLSF